jgi:hypothetical protein
VGIQSQTTAGDDMVESRLPRDWIGRDTVWKKRPRGEQRNQHHDNPLVRCDSRTVWSFSETIRAEYGIGLSV